MTCSETLKNLLDALLKLKADMHESVDASVIDQLQEVIELVEAMIADDAQTAKQDEQLIKALGLFLGRLPSIVELIERLTG